MSIELDHLRAELARLLPLRAMYLELALAVADRDEPLWLDERGGLVAAFLLITHDAPEGGSIRDVKEQEVYLGEFNRHPGERWLAYIAGMLRAAPFVLEHMGVDPGSIMPFDLFSYWELLDDPTLRSADDFVAALHDPDRLDALNRVRIEETWQTALTPCGLAGQTEAVRALLRPALRLELERDDDADDDDDDDSDTADAEALPRPITHRVGGIPDLPPTQPWPEAHGRPLVFVAQFDLAALVRHTAARELPDHGLLAFFYDPQGNDDDLAHAVRVLHFPDAATLAPRTPPPRAERLTPHTLRCTPERQLPQGESEFFYHALLPVDRVLPWYARLAAGNGADPPIHPYPLGCLIADMSERSFERPAHQLLGHPMSIQGDPYLDIEMTTHPRGWDGWHEGTPEAHQLRTQALRWRLLLQIDATQDGELLLNQDGGFFYFWIPDDALAAHDWTRARGALQCH